jgi:hypothetical protein
VAIKLFVSMNVKTMLPPGRGGGLAMGRPAEAMNHDLGLRIGAGEGNRTLMTSLEGCDYGGRDLRRRR